MQNGVRKLIVVVRSNEATEVSEEVTLLLVKSDVTAKDVLIALTIKTKGSLPAGHLTVDDEAGKERQLEKKDDVASHIERVYWNAGLTKKEKEAERARLFAKVEAKKKRVMEKGGQRVNDAEIDERIADKRFQSVLRVKKERGSQKKIAADELFGGSNDSIGSSSSGSISGVSSSTGSIGSVKKSESASAVGFKSSNSSGNIVNLKQKAAK